MVAEDLDHQVSESGSSLHDTGSARFFSLAQILGALNIVDGEARIHINLSHFVALSSPGLELHALELGGVNGVGRDHLVDLVSIVVPFGEVHGQIGVTSVAVRDGIPHTVHVGDSR